jgi:large subunit ribosomal protein L5
MVDLTTYTPRLKALYLSDLRSRLQGELGLANVHQVPGLVKIVVSVGLGKVKEDTRAKELAVATLTQITGQIPVETTAKHSIAAFKLREGQKIGAKVTLRGERMYEFLDRLINIVLPRVRDFHGVPAKAFDKQGNYNLGLTEQSVFPELGFEHTALLHGLQITIVTTADTPDQARALLKAFGMPFTKEGNS